MARVLVAIINQINLAGLLIARYAKVTSLTVRATNTETNIAVLP